MCYSLVGKHGRGPARGQSMKAFSFVISTTLLFWLYHAAILASRSVGAAERSDIRRIWWRIRAAVA